VEAEEQRRDEVLNKEESHSKKRQHTRGNPLHEGGEHLSLDSLSFFFNSMGGEQLFLFLIKM
jgi:hypothetical protein